MRWLIKTYLSSTLTNIRFPVCFSVFDSIRLCFYLNAILEAETGVIFSDSTPRLLTITESL